MGSKGGGRTWQERAGGALPPPPPLPLTPLPTPDPPDLRGDDVEGLGRWVEVEPIP